MTYRTNKHCYIKGFTLAEVLITLSVIGIVAAMTLPSVIGNAQKKAAASKAHKFYNTINNALQFAIAEHGDVTEWMGTPHDSTYDENLEFMKNYFLPYLKYNRYDNCYNNLVCVYLTPGGMFTFHYDINGADIVYFIDGKYNINSSLSRNVFQFQFNKLSGLSNNPVNRRTDSKTTIEPYTYGWNGTYEHLKTQSRYGCRKGSPTMAYCTKLLQMNNWEITDDYPW